MRNKKGFTLIELIAVVSIIGVLSSTAIVGVTKLSNNSKKEYCETSADMLLIAGRDYFNDNKNKLPDNYGKEECVNLEELESKAYIEQMVDYDQTECNKTNTKVCALKQTKNKYYYRKEVDCGKCNIVEAKEEGNKEITITYDKTTTAVTNKDINIKATIDGNGVEIISYKYDIYEMKDGQRVRVGGIDYQENKEADKTRVELNIKLKEKGTFYIEVTGINSYGNTKTKEAGPFNLNYTLDCSSQISMALTSSDVSGTLNERTWYRGTFNIKVSKKGAIYAYDVYVKKSETGYERIITGATNNNTIVYKKDRVLDNKTYQTTLGATETKGYIGRTDTYKIYVIGYNEKGESCRTRDYEYYQDNTDPTCQTSYTSPSSYPDPSIYEEGWTNKNVSLLGTNKDNERETGRVNSGTSGNTTNTITQEVYNKKTSPGIVVDKAGNSITCPSVLVRIDKKDPQCGEVIVTSGTKGTNGWYKSELDLADRGTTDANSGLSERNVKKVEPNHIGCNTTKRAVLTAYDKAGNKCTKNSPEYKTDCKNPTCKTNLSAKSFTETTTTGTGENAVTTTKTYYNCTYTATCNDNYSGVSKCPAASTLTRVSSCPSKSLGSVTDNAGFSSSCDGSGKTDPKPDDIKYAKPKCTITAKKSDGTNYSSGSWTNKNVTVTAQCSGGGGDCRNASQTVSAEGTTTVALKVTAKGGTTDCSKVTVKIDKTKPYIQSGPNLTCGSGSGKSPGHNWGEIIARITVADSGSGLQRVLFIGEDGGEGSRRYFDYNNLGGTKTRVLSPGGGCMLAGDGWCSYICKYFFNGLSLTDLAGNEYSTSVSGTITCIQYNSKQCEPK